MTWREALLPAAHRVGVDVGAAAVVGVLCGACSAVFLRGLDVVTGLRTADERLVWALPVAAALLLVVVDRFAGAARAGTSLVLWRAADGRGDFVTPRLFALGLLGTWWTHLFGGSAGREGTAVQMGGSVADLVVAGLRRLGPVDDDDRRRLLLAGIAGGFGSVFGTPVAGCVFALEVVVVGRVDVVRLVPALVAAVVGDLVGGGVLRALGSAHGVYPALAEAPLAAPFLWRFVVVGVVVGLAARCFIALQRLIKERSAPWPPWLRGLVAGVVVVVIWRLAGSSVLGLSLPTLHAAVHGDDVDAGFFAWKLLATAVTVGAGLIGGEVTPLFAAGAALGTTLAAPLGLPPSLAAVCAMAALFGVCARTPLALSIMAVELCGGAALPHVVVVMAAATLVSGRGSIYVRDVRAAPASAGD